MRRKSAWPCRKFALLSLKPGRRKKIITAVIIVAAVFILLLRVIPLIIPWSGKAALEDTVWSQVVLDREGRILQVRPVNENGLRRIYVPWEQIPKELRRTVRISEDRRFYFHAGFDVFSLARAGVNFFNGNFTGGGGSTITMQLARIIHPRPEGAEMSLGIKLGEIWEALQIESRYSKKQIMELYINLVPFGRNTEGFAAASQLYFGKDLDSLTLSQICMLTVIPRAPSRFNPFFHNDDLLKSAGLLKARMQGEGEGRSISELLLPSEPFAWPFYAPHFVNRLIKEVETYSEGLEDSREAEELICMQKGKSPIHSTLSLEMQEKCRKILQGEVEKADFFRISNGAMLVVNPETMEVLVYLGSANFSDSEKLGQIDGVQMLREPGSTLKPLLYACAIEKGLTAATILPDIPVAFGGAHAYTPENFNQQYNGPVRLRRALAASLNIPAVYTLDQIGISFFTDTLINAGFKSVESQWEGLGLSLAVGGVSVSLAELVQGYGGLYSGGVVKPLRFIKEQTFSGKKVWSEEAAQIITGIISRSDDRVTSFGRSGPLYFDYPAAMKTGTSNQFTNIWAVGFTSDLAGAVWMGNFDGSTVIAAPGSSMPARVLHEVFDEWSKRGELPVYCELDEARICSLSGMAAGRFCPYTMNEYFQKGQVPNLCDWHSRALPGSGSAATAGAGADSEGAGRGRAVVHSSDGAAGEYNSAGDYKLEGVHNLAGGGYGMAGGDESSGRYKSEGAFRCEPHYPQEYMHWAKIYGYDLGFADEAPLEILFPVENEVYYSPHVRVDMIGSGEASLLVNGKTVFKGLLPAEYALSLESGNYTLILRQGKDEVLRRFEVR